MSLPIISRSQLRAGLQSVPGQLWARLGLITLVTLLVGVAGFRTYDLLATVAQTVGRDTVPSIVAAEKIRTQFAYAHTNLVNVFLAKEGPDGRSMQDYAKAMREAHDSLLTAAQNITYGEEERVPIFAMLAGLAEYERAVGAALKSGVYDESGVKADRLMREKILVAAAQLDRANFAHLNSTYRDFKDTARLHQILALFLAVVLVVLLFESQWYIYLRFRRILNPGLLLATVLFATEVITFAYHSSGELSALRSAKEDAFESVHSLSLARALAYGANAMESIYLIQSGNPVAQAAETKRFEETVAQIWRGRLVSQSELPQQPAGFKGMGLLGEELANITFPGEQTVAEHTLLGWIEYARIDQKIRSLEAKGKHAEAVALCLGKQRGESDWAFEKFDEALGATLKINQEAFDALISAAFSHVRKLLYSVVIMVLAVWIGSAVGFRQRLLEFRQ